MFLFTYLKLYIYLYSYYFGYSGHCQYLMFYIRLSMVNNKPPNKYLRNIRIQNPSGVSVSRYVTNSNLSYINDTRAGFRETRGLPAGAAGCRETRGVVRYSKKIRGFICRHFYLTKILKNQQKL